ncbi:hypothetical protein M8C21_006199, partial [Ambrosia artemisiifolia]
LRLFCAGVEIRLLADVSIKICRPVALEYKRLNTIEPHDAPDPIEVKILRTWITDGFRAERCYLLIDKEGSVIQAIVNSGDERHIELQDTYFDFLPHERLHERTAAQSPLTDYIARFNCIITDRKTPTGKLLLKLQVEDTRANFTEIAIWEAVTKTVNRQSHNSAQFPAIIAVTSLKVSIRNNIYQLASTSATHLYLNPPIDLAKEIATRFNAVTIQTRNMITPKDLLEQKTTEHVQQRFVCNAWITSWNENKSWFYRGCKKCNKKVEKKSRHLDLYCISGTLTDNTTTATAILFDASMELFANTTCSEMIHQYTEKDTIPEPIQALKGQPKIFEL